jgi:hypothetical protein
LNAPKNQKIIAKIFLMVFLILMNQGPLGVHYFSNTTFSTTSICSSTTIVAFQNYMLLLPLPLKIELAKLVSSNFTPRGTPPSPKIDDSKCSYYCFSNQTI